MQRLSRTAVAGWLVASLVAVFAVPGACASGLSVVGADTLDIQVGARVAQPFSVKFVDASGAPVGGATVVFGPNRCLPPMEHADTCPPDALYGTTSSVITDAQGIATMDSFTAGSFPGNYDLLAVVTGDASLHTLTLHVRQSIYASPVAIDAKFTGSWFDPAQNGHGLLVEVLPGNYMNAYWFTFDPDGNPLWFGGAATIEGGVAMIDAYRTTHGRWIPHFDASATSAEYWGTLSFSFSDCTHGRVDFFSPLPGYGTGHMELTRLTLPAGLSCD